MDEIPDGVWRTPVTGSNLRGQVLGDVIGDAPTLLVFLRHLG